MDKTNDNFILNNKNAFKDYFADLSTKQEIGLVSEKFKAVRNDLNPPIFTTSSFTTKQLDRTPDQNFTSKSHAIANQSFIVWKSGQVGTLAVDTPMSFKPI